MNKLFKALITLVLAFSIIGFISPSADASSFREVKTVNSQSGVSVYEQATKSSKNLGQLSSGTLVTQYSTANGWAYVESQTLKGYVDVKFLSTPKHTIKIASSKSGLVVKATPSRSAKTVANLKYSMIVKDYGPVGGDWSFVQYGNVTGYVATSFIGNAATKTAYVNSGSGAVARNIASPSGASVGTIANGTKVTVYTTLAGWSFVKAGNIEGYVAANFLSAKAPVKPQVTGGLLPIHNKEYEYSLSYDNESDSQFFQLNKISNSRVLISADDETLYEYRVMNNTMNITLVDEYTFAIPLPLSEGKTWSGSIGGVPVSYKVEYIDGSAETDNMEFSNVVKVTFKDKTNELYGELHLAPGYGVVWLEMNEEMQIILEDVF